MKSTYLVAWDTEQFLVMDAFLVCEGLFSLSVWC